MSFARTYSLTFFGLWMSCTGTIMGPPREEAEVNEPSGPTLPGPSLPTLPNGGGNGTPSTTTPQVGLPISDSKYALAPGIRRLTPDEYVNTIYRLFGVDVSAKSIPGFTTLSHSGMRGIQGLESQSTPDLELFTKLAEEVAPLIAPKVASPPSCAAATTTATCAADIVSFLLRKSFRRTPTPKELEDFQTLFTTVQSAATTREATKLSSKRLCNRLLSCTALKMSDSMPFSSQTASAISFGRRPPTKNCSRSQRLEGSMTRRHSELKYADSSTVLRASTEPRTSSGNGLAPSRRTTAHSLHQKSLL